MRPFATIVSAVVFIGVCLYLSWRGILIDTDTVRIRAPQPGDSTAWCREDCTYLTLTGFVTVAGPPQTVEQHRAEGSQCKKLRDEQELSRNASPIPR